jgi:hypothetical protein
MAAEDAGTIEAKIVLKIAELKKDVVEAMKSLENLTTELKNTEKASESTGKNSQKAVKQLADNYEKSLKKIESSLKSNVIDEKEAAAARLKAGNDYIRSLTDQKTALEKNADQNAKQIAEIDTLIEKQQELNGTLEKGSGSIGGFGKVLGGDFMGAVQNAASGVKIFGVSLNTALGPIGIIIGAAIVVFKALSGVIGAAKEAGEKYAATLSKVYRKTENLSDETEDMSISISKAEEATATFNVILADVDFTARLVGKSFNWLKERLADFLVLIHAVSKEERAAIAEQEKFGHIYDSIDQAMQDYKKTKQEITILDEEAILTEKELAEERSHAIEGYIRQLVEQQAALSTSGATATESGKTRYKQIINEIALQKSALQVEKDKIAAFEKAENDAQDQRENDAGNSANIVEQVNLLKQAEEQYNKTLAQTASQRAAGYIDAQEEDRQRLQATNQYIEALSGIKDEYHELGSEAEEQAEAIRLLEAAQIEEAAKIKERIAYQKSLIKSNEDYIAALGDLDREYQTILSDAQKRAVLENESLSDYEKQVELLELQRQKAILELNARYAALEAQREEHGLTEQEIAERDRLTESINRNFSAMKDGIKEVEKVEEEIEEKAKGQTLAEKIIGHDAYKIGVSAVSSIMNVASAMMDVLQEQARRASAEVDRMLKENQEKIEEQRQAALEAAGFAEAQEAESMQAQIDRAREAGDQVLEYQLKRRQEEMRINEQYDALAEAEAEKAEREKANIEYEAAMQKHRLDITNAIVNAAQAIVMAWAQGGAISGAIFAGITAAATAAQIGIIASNPPEKPSFESGGIVPGQNYKGDNVLARVNSGELILNRAQQDSVAGQLAGGGVTHLTVVLQVDRREMAQTIFDIAGDGLVDMPLRLRGR